MQGGKREKARPRLGFISALTGTQGALARQNDIPLVRAIGTGLLPVSVERGAKVVGAWVDAGRVDVVVLCKVAHGGEEWWW